MSDRFKFRAWNINCNRWFKHGVSFKDMAASDCKEYTIEQCTGLKDKNGTLIYEGDVVKWLKPFGDDRNYLVKWHHAEAEYSIRDNQSQIEIIGNIHENPELLEESK